MPCLNEFEFLPEPTTDYWIISPRASENSNYDVVATLGPSFLVEYSSFLQVTKTVIKSRMIRSSTSELAAFERLEPL